MSAFLDIRGAIITIIIMKMIMNSSHEKKSHPFIPASALTKDA